MALSRPPSRWPTRSFCVRAWASRGPVRSCCTPARSTSPVRPTASGGCCETGSTPRPGWVTRCRTGSSRAKFCRRLSAARRWSGSTNSSAASGRPSPPSAAPARARIRAWSSSRPGPPTRPISNTRTWRATWVSRSSRAPISPRGTGTCFSAPSAGSNGSTRSCGASIPRSAIPSSCTRTRCWACRDSCTPPTITASRSPTNSAPARWKPPLCSRFSRHSRARCWAKNSSCRASPRGGAATRRRGTTCSSTSIPS